LFAASSIGMIAVGLMHAGTHVTPPPPGSEAALEAMRAFSVTALGLTWSVEDAYDTLSLSYSWMSIWLGVAGLVVLRVLRPEPRALRALAALFALGAAVLVAISAAHRDAPPLHLYALVAALYGVAAARARSARSAYRAGSEVRDDDHAPPRNAPRVPRRSRRARRPWSPSSSCSTRASWPGPRTSGVRLRRRAEGRRRVRAWRTVRTSRRLRPARSRSRWARGRRSHRGRARRADRRVGLAGEHATPESAQGSATS
jgi:hypothetical protein